MTPSPSSTWWVCRLLKKTPAELCLEDVLFSTVERGKRWRREQVQQIQMKRSEGWDENALEQNRDVEMSIGQQEEEETREGERICVDIQQAVLWLTTTPQANTWAVSFTVTKLDLDCSGFGACFLFFCSLSGFVRIVTIQGLVRGPNQAPKWGRFLLRAHTHTHKLNRSSSSFSRYHPQFALWISRTYEPLMSSVRLFVMGALQRRCCVLICSGDDSPWMRWSGLWDVCLSHSHSVGVRKQHQLQLVVFSFYSRDAVNL